MMTYKWEQGSKIEVVESFVKESSANNFIGRIANRNGYENDFRQIFEFTEIFMPDGCACTYARWRNIFESIV